MSFILPTRNRPWRQSVSLALEEMFMPIQWRTTCTPDYLAYQTYDSLQAIFSSISGMIASRETLVSLGVSRSDATVGSALFLEVSSEAVSRMASILFSWAYAYRLDAECKKYRFLADVFNDASLVLSTFSSSIDSFPLRALVIISAASLRALCGVCAGSSKAALTNHFAIHPASVADINAKDGSQETVIYLVGLLLGSLIVPGLGEGRIWWALVLLVGLHLWANYQAVRHVHLTSLNLTRLGLVLSAWLSSSYPSLTSPLLSKEGEGFERREETGEIATPAEVAATESLFFHTSPLLDLRYLREADLPSIAAVEPVEEGLVRSYRLPRGKILVALAEGATHLDLVHGLVSLVGRQVSSRPPAVSPEELCRRMTAAGWDLSRDAMAYDGLYYKRTD